MGNVLKKLMRSGYSVLLTGLSAVDRYCGLKPLPYRQLATDADLTALARLFDNLRFPGSEIADAAVESPENGVSYLYCLERIGIPKPVFRSLSFAWDPETKAYQDPLGVYPIVRRFRDGKTTAPCWFSPDDFQPSLPAFVMAATAAIIIARYKNVVADNTAPIDELVQRINGLPDRSLLKIESQQNILNTVLVSRRSDLGLKLLYQTGFVAAHWPELAAMNQVEQAKEFHPEGNVWEHTLETFRHRKTLDLALSLALLLHDIGKTQAAAYAGSRFHRHAELGAFMAGRFLNQLGYNQELITRVDFLVRNHMLPAALPRLPLTRTESVLESPWFPLLLELYRCDEASSFKGLDGFYESCAAYQNYLKNVKNPFRTNDGKKLMKKLFYKPASNQSN